MAFALRRWFLALAWGLVLAWCAAAIIGMAVLGILFVLSKRADAQEQPQVFLEPPPFFEHPAKMAKAIDPYNGKCKRQDGADCCGWQHCYPVPSDDLGHLQLKDGNWIDPQTMVPPPTICESSNLPPGYNWLDHVCEGSVTYGSMPAPITCVFLKGQSS